MGNHKFRLSDMMPNAWFYKLRDMSIKSRSSTHINNNPYPTKSSYRITDTNPNNKTFFDKSPRKSSSKKKSKRKTVYMPSPKKQPQINNNPSVLFPGPDRSFPVWLKPGTVLDHHQERFPEDDESDSLDAATCNDDSCCTCKLVATTTSSDEDDDGDIIIDVSGNNRTTIDNLVNGFEEFNELPPIRTKPAAKPALPSSENDGNAPRAKKSRKIAARKSVSRAGGVKIRANGPRVATNGSSRKPTSVKLSGDRDYDYDYDYEDEEKKKKKGLSFYSESFAIVKASFDPEKDFRESMMEMIVENNIRASKELEHLLACYLSLNSYQYHDLIVKAFEQIWFNMPQLEIN